MKVNTLFAILALLIISACNTPLKPITANQPTIKDYVVGERWEYTWKTSAGEKIRGEGKTAKEVVVYKMGWDFYMEKILFKLPIRHQKKALLLIKIGH